MDSNPFADPEENPFGDSGVQGGAGQGGALDDYNPFAQKPSGAAATLPPPPPAQTVAAPQPSVTQSADTKTDEPPPAYQPSAAQQVDTSELQRRQDELERKAAELQEREQRMRERNAAGIKENNWPPLPAGCPVKPCFYQDIDLEIPPEFQRIVRLAYATWITRSIFYLLNFFFAIGYFAVSQTGTLVPGTTLGLSILWLILWVPLSFLCWYRPVYKALRSDSSINYFWFFLVCAIQVLVDILKILGPGATGYLGLLTAVPYINYSPSSSTTDVSKQAVQSVHNMGYVILVLVFVAIILCVLDLFLLIKVHRYYRGTGASFQQAQTEFASGVLRNENVRAAGAQLAADAAAGAVNNAANNASNRY